MKLKRIVEQAGASSQYYDLGKDFTSFKHTIDSADEEVKNRFEQAISSKIKGKKIRARASRGYKQFEKDYDVDVASVSLDDYYDNYVVVARSPKGKEYFLKPGFKVQILGAMEVEKPEDPKPQPQAEQPPQQPQPQPQPQPQATPSASPEAHPVKEEVGDASQTKSYPKSEIARDSKNWLPKLLMNGESDMNMYIPQDGIYKNQDRKTTIGYGVTVPVDEVPALTVDQIKQSLSSASQGEGDSNQRDNFYTLEKFDVRNGKYVIIIKKITNH